MPKGSRFVQETGQILQHPAVIAWKAFRSNEPLPCTVEVLKTPEGRYPNTKSRVYRLTGRFSFDAPVFVKLTHAASVRVERIIYMEILPRLSVTRVRCHGTLDAEDEMAWIFLEPARGEFYQEEDEGHHRVATQWLAAVHTASSRLDLSDRLPGHSAGRYLHCLAQGRERIEPNMNNPVLKPHELTTLERILRLWDIIDRNWLKLEAACGEMPKCLVHGDFVKKNVRIHQTRDGAAVYPLDWDISGWGVPAVDIERMDPVIYEKSVRHHWPHLGLRGVRKMANVGVILRNLGLINETSVGLPYDWVETTMNELGIYEACLAEAIHREGWR